MNTTLFRLALSNQKLSPFVTRTPNTFHKNTFTISQLSYSYSFTPFLHYSSYFPNAKFEHSHFSHILNSALVFNANTYTSTIYKKTLSIKTATEVVIHGCFFQNCRALTGQGGALRATDIQTFILLTSDCFANCSSTAEDGCGGAIYTEDISGSSKIVSTTFSRCYATTRGQSFFISAALDYSFTGSHLLFHACGYGTAGFHLAAPSQLSDFNFSNCHGGTSVLFTLMPNKHDSQASRFTIIKCRAEGSNLFYIDHPGTSLVKMSLEKFNYDRNLAQNYLGQFTSIAASPNSFYFSRNEIDTIFYSNHPNEITFQNCKADRPFLEEWVRWDPGTCKFQENVHETLELSQIKMTRCFNKAVIESPGMSAATSVLILFIVIFGLGVGGGFAYYYFVVKKANDYNESLKGFTDDQHLIVNPEEQ